jgi:hypothetical protein
VLAVLIGALALVAGVMLLLLPLLVPLLARPRDGLWAAVVLLLGLVLVTAADRLTGAPMLGVLCSGLLIGRLASEVGQQRWIQLDLNERQLLRDRSHWQKRYQALLNSLAVLFAWLQERLRKPVQNKKWVRPEAPVEPEPAPVETKVIHSLDDIDALLDASGNPIASDNG